MPADNGAPADKFHLKIFRRFDHYGDALNHFDLLKAIALVTMVLDHLGYYFFPDALWLRAVGRMAFPLFLFLVGYSGKWDIRPNLMFYAAFLVVTGAMLHFPVFSLNILVTIILTRVAMAWITRLQLTSEELGGIFILSGVLVFCSMKYVDYGTLGILFALCGYLQQKKPASAQTLIFLGLTIVLQAIIEYVVFWFHGFTLGILVAVAGINMYLMASFKLNVLSPNGFPLPLRRTIQWLSRNTLPLYALHIFLFMLLAHFWTLQGKMEHFRWF